MMMMMISQCAKIFKQASVQDTTASSVMISKNFKFVETSSLGNVTERSVGLLMSKIPTNKALKSVEITSLESAIEKTAGLRMSSRMMMKARKPAKISNWVDAAGSAADSVMSLKVSCIKSKCRGRRAKTLWMVG